MNKTDINRIIKEELNSVLHEAAPMFKPSPWKRIDDMEQDLDAYMNYVYTEMGYDGLDNFVSAIQQKALAYKAVKNKVKP